MAPTTFIREWDEVDRGLALGLQALEETTGPYGYRLEDELDADNDGYFKAVPEVNFAARAVDLYRANEKKNEPGESLRVIFEKEK